MTEISPEGTVWWCTHCGRIAADKQGRMAALGWTRECTQNAVLVHENSMKLDENGRVVQAAPVDKAENPKASGKSAEIGIAPEKGQSGSN
jgi:hypothetical protein